MPNKFRKLPQADLDLDSIWDFVAVDDIQAAERLINRIGNVFQMLIENPLAGRERPNCEGICAVSQSETTLSSTALSPTASKSFA
ncbi:plasmid stabilization system protein ParE [Bradyrhizobium sp. AZCC 1693]